MTKAELVAWFRGRERLHREKAGHLAPGSPFRAGVDGIAVGYGCAADKAAELADPPACDQVAPTAVAEPGVPRRGCVWRRSVWGELGGGGPHVPEPSGLSVPCYLAEGGGYVVSCTGLAAALDKYPVTVQECPKGERPGPEIPVPAGWRVEESQRSTFDGPAGARRWYVLFARLPGRSDRLPRPLSVPGWAEESRYGADGDRPGVFLVERPAGVPFRGVLAGGQGVREACDQVARVDPAAVRRAALVEAAGVCDREAGNWAGLWEGCYASDRAGEVLREAAGQIRDLAGAEGGGG